MFNEYFGPAYEKWQERHGGRGPLTTWSSPITIFPNMSLGGGISTVAVWDPVGPRITEGCRWYFVDRGGSRELRARWRDDERGFSGPSGIQESDDMENWNYASEASSGIVARRHRYNYTQGVGHEERIPELPDARISRTITSEQNARGMYWRWAQMMDAKDWDQLREWDEAERR
jgi:hypothetical protein